MSSAAARLLRCALLAWALAAPPAGADEVGEALEASLAAQRAARDSQARVNRLDDETKALREKERAAQWQALQLSAYADQLEQEAAAEEKKRQQLEEELARVASTGTDLLPLLRRMVVELDAFIAADLPFQQTLRQQRVRDLKALLDDDSRRSADKFRRVIDAYRSEVDYGHAIGTEDAELDCGGVGRGQATLVHVGRIGFYCLSADARNAGVWDAGRKIWRRLDDDAIAGVQRAIAVARGESPPELLVLPVRKAP